MKGQTVLDVGCAEGLVSIQCFERDAKLVHGIEIRHRAVEVARSLAGIKGISEQVKFFQGNLKRPNSCLKQDGLLEKYDIILANVVIHKVTTAAQLFKELLGRCQTTFVIRLGNRRLRKGRWKYTDVVNYAAKEGFHLEWEACGYPLGDPPYTLDGEAWMGVLRRVDFQTGQS